MISPFAYSPQALNLYFPQWQGGNAREIYTGAAWLHQHFGDASEFQAVSVGLAKELAVKHQILGYDAIFRQLTAARKLLAQHQPTQIFTLGGDCSVDLAPISYLNQRYEGDLAVLWLDAHADLNTPDSSPSQHFHGMPLRSLLNQGEPSILQRLFSTLRAEQIFLAGGRAFDPAEQAYLVRQQIQAFSVHQLQQNPQVITAAIQSAGFRHVHLHLDLDVLDPEAFPFVTCPAAKGLSIQQFAHIVQAVLIHCAVVGVTLTEFAITTSQRAIAEPVMKTVLEAAFGQ